MELKRVQPNLVKYEIRMAQGQDPNVREQHKPGFFGRVLSGTGKILGTTALPLSIIFPPAAIGAAGMYGLGQIGDQMQMRAYMGAIAKQQSLAGTQVTYPGMDANSQMIMPTGYNVSARDQQIMKVLGARNDAMVSMGQQF